VSDARRRRLPGTVWGAMAIAVSYFAVEQLFAYETSTRGLLSPSGTPHVGVLALGAAFLALRMAACFVVPALVVLAVLDALLETWKRARATR
jgi:hypothetical protein